MTAVLTVPDAARLARVHETEIRTALATGDIRNLTPKTVEAWAHSRVAHIVTLSAKP